MSYKIRSVSGSDVSNMDWFGLELQKKEKKRWRRQRKLLAANAKVQELILRTISMDSSKLVNYAGSAEAKRRYYVGTVMERAL